MFIPRNYAVFGAGIAGLSAAHELAELGHQVTVYEASDSPGGMAKSYRHPDTNLPSEYSWRGYGGFYKNVFHMMQKIPSPIIKSNLTVYDTELSRPIKFILVENNVVNSNDAEAWTQHFNLSDWYTLFSTYAKELMSDQRTDQNATINAADYLKNRLDDRSINNIKSIFGPWLGIDPQRTSLHHLANFFRMIEYPDIPKPYTHFDYQPNGKVVNSSVWYQGAGDKWLVMKRPTSEGWFDPWVTYLKTTFGVKFIYNTKLCSLSSDSNNICHAIVDGPEDAIRYNNTKRQGFTTYVGHVIRHDGYILAINPFATSKIVGNSCDQVKKDTQLALFNGLIQDGPHIQISFRIGYTEPIHTPEPYMAFILPDSPYNITMYFQNEIWYDNVSLGDGIITLISGTACVSYIPGLFGKKMTELTKEEFQQEIITQINECTNLNHIIADANNGKPLNSFTPFVFEAWKDWKFGTGDIASTLTPEDTKWVNSTQTNVYMPSIKTSFHNLTLAGAHIKTSVDLYSMEAACATGRDAAFTLMNADLPKNLRSNNKAFVVNKPLWSYVMGKADNIFYLFGLPNILNMICVVFLAWILYWCLRKKIRTHH